jgi:hypothetical protein
VRKAVAWSEERWKQKLEEVAEQDARREARAHAAKPKARREADGRKAAIRAQADVVEALGEPAPTPEVALLLRQREQARQLLAGTYGRTPVAEPVTPATMPEVPASLSEARYAERAVRALRKASPKAVGVLVAGLASPNEWVKVTCARAIIERTLPTAPDPSASGPAIVLPPGTKIAIAAVPVAALPEGVRRDSEP